MLANNLCRLKTRSRRRSRLRLRRSRSLVWSTSSVCLRLLKLSRMICAVVGVTVMLRGCIPKAGLFHRTDCEAAGLRYLSLSLGCDGCRQVIERLVPFVYTSPLKYMIAKSISSSRFMTSLHASFAVASDTRSSFRSDIRVLRCSRCGRHRRR